MTKQYKQPEEIKVEDTTLIEPVYLNDTLGSLTVSITVPTGQPKRLIDQIVLVLNEGSGITAGSFVTGSIYKITTVGNTSFTSIGAKQDEANLFFVATGAGSGTGSATLYTIRMYVYVPQFNVWRYSTLT